MSIKTEQRLTQWYHWQSYPFYSFAFCARLLQVNSTSSNVFHCLPLYMFVQLHSLKLSDTHLSWPWGPFPLARPPYREWDGVCLSVWSWGLCWREITLCLQIMKDFLSFLITSSLSSTHYVFSSALSLPICPYIWVLHNALMLILSFFFHLISLFLCPLHVFVFSVPFLINVLLGCVTRELKAQGDFLKDKAKTIALLHSSYLIYPWTMVDICQASVCFNHWNSTLPQVCTPSVFWLY